MHHAAPRTVLSLSLAATLVLSLAACAGTPTDAAEPAAANTAAVPQATEPAPPMPEPQCDADAARVVVGQVATPAVIEQARVAAGASVARTIAPDQMVTLEYLGERLNLDVDKDNVVTAVRCG